MEGNNNRRVTIRQLAASRNPKLELAEKVRTAKTKRIEKRQARYYKAERRAVYRKLEFNGVVDPSSKEKTFSSTNQQLINQLNNCVDSIKVLPITDYKRVQLYIDITDLIAILQSGTISSEDEANILEICNREIPVLTDIYTMDAGDDIALVTDTTKTILLHIFRVSLEKLYSQSENYSDKQDNINFELLLLNNSSNSLLYLLRSEKRDLLNDYISKLKTMLQNKSIIPEDKYKIVRVCSEINTFLDNLETSDIKESFRDLGEKAIQMLKDVISSIEKIY